MLADTPAAIEAAATHLASGRGRYAVDVERAPSHQYSPDACLVQIAREGAGTFLFDAHLQPQAVAEHLATLLNGQDWLLHSGANDLPNLHTLGLTPGSVVDTEITARILDLPKVNLATLAEHCVGVHLAKGFGQENWASRPLPTSWQHYAAMDVFYLNAIDEVLRQEIHAQGKQRIFEEEMAWQTHLYQHFQSPSRTWLDIKGVHRLRTRQQLAAAQALWQVRERIAQEHDVPVAQVLKDPHLITLASKLPRGWRDAQRLLPPQATRPAWMHSFVGCILDTLRAPKHSYPELAPGFGFTAGSDHIKVPPRNQWQALAPDAYKCYGQVEAELREIASSLDIPLDILLTPAVLREVVWSAVVLGQLHNRSQIHDALRQAGARPWQREAVLEVLVHALIDQRA